MYIRISKEAKKNLFFYVQYNFDIKSRDKVIP